MLRMVGLVWRRYLLHYRVHSKKVKCERWYGRCMTVRLSQVKGSLRKTLRVLQRKTVSMKGFTQGSVAESVGRVCIID